jgi:ABC-2 type transport system ATP-binding protein
MSKKEILSVRELRKIYQEKTPFTAVDGISFDLGEGEILGFLGPNGAGKTTTIQMLIGTLSYTSGSIQYFGKELQQHRSEILQHVVFASTYVSLPWRLTVAQNLRVFGYLYGLNRRETDRRMMPLLERFGIASKIDQPIASLSAGQVTRLMLIKAFLVEPKIALLDEPTASLDPDIAQDVCAFLLEERKRRGLSILFTSHKMDEAAALCDRVIFVRKGKIIANDVPSNLSKSLGLCKLELHIDDGMKRAVSVVEEKKMGYRVDQRTIECTIEERNIAELLNLLAVKGVGYSQIRIRQPSLEDYFLKVVGKL